MASEQKHFEQYKRNRKLLSDQCFDVDKSSYLDWVVMISFYAAVHLIEMELAKAGLNSRSHEVRNDNIAKISNLKQLSQPYYTLYMESRKARYECRSYASDAINKILLLLKKIEDSLPN